MDVPEQAAPLIVQFIGMPRFITLKPKLTDSPEASGLAVGRLANVWCWPLSTRTELQELLIGAGLQVERHGPAGGGGVARVADDHGSAVAGVPE